MEQHPEHPERSPKGTFLPKAVAGVTHGFGQYPENRASGHWRPEDTISFQYRKFLSMTTKELKEFASRPESEKTVAQEIAYGRVVASRKSLADTKELTDRTEGKAKEALDITSLGEKIEPVVIYRPEKLDDNTQAA